MWMLLDPSRRKLATPEPSRDLASDVAGARDRKPKPRSTSARVSLLAFLGGAADVSHAGSAPAPVTVFLHPGRSQVATASIDRVFDQFECVPPEVHATLAEAEARHEGEVGFLIEVTRPFTDPRGVRYASGVLFARSVRD